MGNVRRLFFSIWYFFNPPWDTGVSPPELMAHLGSHPAGRALDLGCGSGTNVITMAQHGWQVTGIDFAPSAIRIARRKLRSANVEASFLVADVTQTVELNMRFDLILDMGCFHGLTSEGRRNYAQNMDGWLADDGTFLLYVFFRDPVENGTGLVESDLDVFTPMFELVERQDGTERGIRPSAWLTYRRLKVQE